MADINAFISKFYGPTHEYVHQLDPFSTFFITMKFFPCKADNGKAEEGFLDSIVNGAANMAAGMASNLLNNATGGLAAAIGSYANDSIMQQHDANQGNSTKISFIDYLSVASMLGSADPSAMDTLKGAIGMSGSPSGLPMIDFTAFVQDITVPFLSQNGADESQSIVGKFPTNGSFIMPDNNELIIDVLNTKLPVAEYIFYPWMREVTLPYWAYDTQPYTTATVTVDFSKHMDLQYVFCGCRPKTIQTMQPNNIVDGSQLKRQVTLLFDYMFITSKKMSAQPDAMDLLMGTAGELLGGAGSMLGI